MPAPRPAAGAAFAGEEVFTDAHELAVACLFLFRNLDPADPFVAGERGEIDPRRQHIRVREQQRAQILRQLVHDASGKRLHHHVRTPRVAH